MHVPANEELTVNVPDPVAELPIWANHATFSFEPYFVKSLVAGEAAQWGIAYRFGEDSQSGEEPNQMKAVYR